jgi:Tfp pilus assembly protein FimV
MNYTNKAVARHIDRAMAREEHIRKQRTQILTAAAIIAIFALVLLLSSARTEREYAEDTVTVRSGDTLWSIASEYCPEGMDKRDYVQLLQSDNGCTADIRVGDVLTVRVYK